jgi:uncharacterized protein (TIGR02145 family)
MKKLLFIISIICVSKTNAQNYLISFVGTGASTTVGSVKVENLTAKTSLILNGTDVLRLTGTTGVSSTEKRQEPEMKIYPNPTTGFSIVAIYPSIAGDAVIAVYENTGKRVFQDHIYLDNSLQEYRLSGLKNGLYLIDVICRTYHYSGKLLFNGKPSGKIRVEKTTNSPAAIDKQTNENVKGIRATVDMIYSIGNRLKFTGISGNYSTVIMDIPTGGKTLTFNYVPCTDGDNNNYPVVGIGPQIWMAENLKTTKYNDGTPLPNITINASWFSYTGAYGDYDNTPANSTSYGRLYNWYAVDNNAATKVASNGGKNICPTSWHVPADAEWTALTTYLGGELVAGGKLKETWLTHWITPNAGATNESGFTALPGGVRSFSDGVYYSIGSYGYWWSTTEFSSTNVWERNINFNYPTVARANYQKQGGLSVRCLKD